MDVREFYSHALAERGYEPDPAQLRAIDRLQRSYEEWTAYKSVRSNSLKRLVLRPDLPRGVYMWGGVGRGKSFLMDSFYSVVPLVRKTRLHFHEFMREVHRELDELKGDPDLLYPDGLHRDRMLPTIQLLKDKLDIMNIDAGIDYRKRALEQVDIYHTPLNAATDEALRQAFAAVADTADEDPRVNIESREIRALRRAGTAIWFDFATLCGGPRSQNDYLELASRFKTVILSGIPRMSVAMSSEARRFTWLIDVFYDHKVKLIMSAEVPPEELYTVGQLANEFQRAVSRIIEMQSREYMDAERRDAAASIT